MIFDNGLMDEILIILILAAIVAYWWDSAGAYERAYRAAKQACEEGGVQLLDDTLERTRIRPCRHEKGYMHLCREYEFEFSSDGEIRYHGKLKLKGHRLQHIEMQPYRMESNLV